MEFSIASGSALIKRLRSFGPLQWIPQKLTCQIILSSSIAWVPLLLFTAHEGLAYGNKVQIPFLLDLVQYSRFLIALPCAIAVGKLINPRLRNVLNSFVRNGILSNKDIDRFELAISRTATLASSKISELVILALVYSYTALGLYRDVSQNISSWNSPHSGAAGWWFVWVSMPIFLFSWFVWIWRLGVWALLLCRISWLDLRVVATHPDNVGGLNFINVGVRRFSVLLFGISSILCAAIGEEILFNGAHLRSYEMELTLFFMICVAAVLGPLMMFTPVLVRSKLEHWSRYGRFSSQYVQQFDDKWVAATGQPRESPLGTPDIQSLADLRNSYAGISQMRTILPDRMTFAIFAAAYVLPAIPLLGTVISLRRVISELYSLLLK